MHKTITLSVLAASIVGIGSWVMLTSESYAPVQARVVEVSEHCYVRTSAGGDSRLSNLLPCETAAALVRGRSGDTQVARVRSAQLLFTAPSNGQPVTVPVAEAAFSSTPLREGEVIVIRSGTRHAGNVRPN